MPIRVNVSRLDPAPASRLVPQPCSMRRRNRDHAQDGIRTSLLPIETDQYACGCVAVMTISCVYASRREERQIVLDFGQWNFLHPDCELASHEKMPLCAV